ncbi:MAG TPA: FAD-binding oxidoreductase [Stellaceae bacterium]|nr:FAD-binding oxidoreductase [Stellaceae bacterium]
MPAQTADFLVIGAGMAGASAAAHLAEAGRVILLEGEDQPGYHSTGRSAALFSETYGPPPVRILTRAGRGFYEDRAGGLAEHPILSARGALVYAMPRQERLLDTLWAELAPRDPTIRRLDAAELRRLVPVLRPEQAIAGVLEPGAMDIDVHGLHSAYLRLLRRRGGRFVNAAPVTRLAHDGGVWTASTPAGEFAAPVVVNAAGAWADAVAALAGLPPIGIVPKRRTALIVPPPPGMAIGSWPLTIDAAETGYFKPEAGKLLVSPADETPVAPSDVQPEELDVAIAIDRLAERTTIAVHHVERKWAGLRSFAADKVPVVGFDPLAPGFFWLAGQGGYGIQAAEGLARSAAGLISEGKLPADIAALGLDAAALSPARFGRR